MKNVLGVMVVLAVLSGFIGLIIRNSNVILIGILFAILAIASVVDKMNSEK